MSKDVNLSRRTMLAGAASLAPAAATGASEESASDLDLRRLWSEYLSHVSAYAVAEEKYKPARAAFDAELPPCPEDVLLGHHWSAHNWLWQKHGLDPLYDARDAVASAMHETIATILHTEAEGLFGIGVKLAALPNHWDAQDCVDAVAAVQQDIDRLIGTNFAERVRTSDEFYGEGSVENAS
jgi:hypothetical protein